MEIPLPLITAGSYLGGLWATFLPVQAPWIIRASDPKPPTLCSEVTQQVPIMTRLPPSHCGFLRDSMETWE